MFYFHLLIGERSIGFSSFLHMFLKIIYALQSNQTLHLCFLTTYSARNTFESSVWQKLEKRWERFFRLAHFLQFLNKNSRFNGERSHSAWEILCAKPDCSELCLVSFEFFAVFLDVLWGGQTSPQAPRQSATSWTLLNLFLLQLGSSTMDQKSFIAKIQSMHPNTAKNDCNSSNLANLQRNTNLTFQIRTIFVKQKNI